MGLSLSFLLASCGQTGQKAGNPSDPKTAGVETTLAVPLDAAQASALQGVVADAAVDIYLNEQLIAEGLEGGIRGGRRGGIRGATSTPPPAARRQSTGELLVAFEVTFLMPAQLASGESLNLRTVIRSSTQTNLTFVEVKTTVQLRTAPGGTSVEVVEQSLNSNQVAWPDLDGDGVSTLNEVVASGVNAALDGSTKPTEQQIQQALGTLSIKLEQVLKEQGITATITVADLDKTPPDTIATCPPTDIAEREVSITFNSTEKGSTFLCQLDTSTPVRCASPFAQISLSAGEHLFTVHATDPAGNVDLSPAACTWTITLPLPPKLSAPTGLNLSPGNASATFSWTAVSGAKSYRVYYGTSSGSRSNPLTSTNASVTVTGLLNGVKYYFSVSAVDGAGIEGAISDEVSTTPNVPPPSSSTTPSSPSETTPPTFAGLGSATAVSTSQINLTWTAATDNETAASGIVYKICRSTTSGTCQTGFTATYTSTAGATSYSVTGLNTSTAYYFVVRAQDAAGNTDANTIQKTATTLSPDTTPPGFGGLAAATATSSTQIDLSWAAATDDVSVGSAIVYDVCQSTIPTACTSVFSTTFTTASGATGVTVAGLSEGTRYFFVVRARDQAGNQDYNNLEKSAVTITGGVLEAVSAGFEHTCTLLVDGTARCWGRNQWGQLGDGTSVDRLVPIVVTSLTQAVAFSAGKNHSCALLADGSAKCWGDNFNGQLGIASGAGSKVPEVVTSLTGAVAVNAGHEHTCALLVDGSAKCWGDNSGGQVGDGSTFDRYFPVAVTSLTGAVAATAGVAQSCALLSDGVVKCWGFNYSGELGDGTTTNRSAPVQVSVLTGATAISAGYTHTCALKADGTVHCWGSNGNGELGDGTTVNKNTPVSVSTLTGAVAVSGGGFSPSHTCTLLSDGTARCWGSNMGGQLGENNACGTVCTTPVLVSNLTNAIAVSAGKKQHSCALMANGTAKCWGGNIYGEIGDGTTMVQPRPVMVTNLSGAASVFSPGLHASAASGAPARPWRESPNSGGHHTCAMLSGGLVKCWGLGAYGQLGDGTAASYRTRAVVVTSLFNVASISPGIFHTCALISDGTVKCWGDNTNGQLGDGTTTAKSTPVSVPSLSGIVLIGPGSYHSCALTATGTVQCWGRNGYAQVGNGTTTDVTSPSTVSNLSNVFLAGGGLDHSCAALADGSVKCWGRNNYGQLGDGTTVNKTTPTAVTNLSSVVELLTESGHNCALLAGGTVKCWGGNLFGQVGDGSFIDRWTPVAVSSLSGVIRIVGKYDHTCAQISDGSMKCWGDNYAGKIGDGSETKRNTPVAISSITGVETITAGFHTTCALMPNGTLKCWGRNDYGQLGIGTISGPENCSGPVTCSKSPVAVLDLP